jgi:hypothetical protein
MRMIMIKIKGHVFLQAHHIILVFSRVAMSRHAQGLHLLLGHAWRRQRCSQRRRFWVLLLFHLSTTQPQPRFRGRRRQGGGLGMPFHVARNEETGRGQGSGGEEGEQRDGGGERERGAGRARGRRADEDGEGRRGDRRRHRRAGACPVSCDAHLGRRRLDDGNGGRERGGGGRRRRRRRRRGVQGRWRGCRCWRRPPPSPAAAPGPPAPKEATPTAGTWGRERCGGRFGPSRAALRRP